ncbi:hypothetical protein ACFV98_24460 [Streptomyces violascens]|uniref:hypothetical protein n=1 Tax=Streptomyces violascens TaxID=67381 RepID=UPI003654B546
MSSLHRIPRDGTGPEDVVFDGLGQVLAGVADGRILRIALPESPGGHAPIQEVGRTGGRPHGLEVPPDGRLLVCEIDSYGRVVREVRGAGRRCRMATSVAERDGRLVLGSLAEDAFAWCDWGPPGRHEARWAARDVIRSGRPTASRTPAADMSRVA